MIDSLHLFFFDEVHIEPLFDFDDTKTLVLLFLIKLLSVSRMNLTPKVNPSLRTLKTLKNLSFSVRIRIHMERIRIHMTRMQTKLKWNEKIQVLVLGFESIWKAFESG